MKKVKYKTLQNGIKMPMLGFGTLHIPPDESEHCVQDAFDAGYRLIDTAAAYFNEREIGEAIRKSHIDRRELFITSKVWIQDAGYEKTWKAFHTSLDKLGLEYLDLYLIHHPFGDYYGAWKAMEKLYHQGKIRAIGVCNFNTDRFIDLYLNASVKPMINQIECHPFFQQSSSLPVFQEYQCQIQSWGPLNEGQCDIFHHPLLLKIAHKHEKSVAQIILRWHIQKGSIAIPKTTQKARMIENMDIWDFELDEDDLKLIKNMDIGHSEIIDHQCYLTAKRLNSFRIHE